MTTSDKQHWSSSDAGTGLNATEILVLKQDMLCNFGFVDKSFSIFPISILLFLFKGKFKRVSL